MIALFEKYTVVASSRAQQGVVALRAPRPIMPGHLLVAPTDPVHRAAQLADETYDALWALTMEAQADAESQGGATASNILLKDGPAAGPPLPHLHVHVVPRRPNDLERNDWVFEALDRWAPSDATQAARAAIAKPPVPDDSQRRNRTPEEMSIEAAGYREQRQQAEGGGPFYFATIRIDPSSIFAQTVHSVAFVNLRPLVPGHVLVSPRRAVKRLCELTPTEATDLWRTVRSVQATVEIAHGARASELGVQDGVDAGQTVPHVHVHVLPRVEMAAAGPPISERSARREHHGRGGRGRAHRVHRGPESDLQ